MSSELITSVSAQNDPGRHNQLRVILDIVEVEMDRSMGEMISNKPDLALEKAQTDR